MRLPSNQLATHAELAFSQVSRLDQTSLKQTTAERVKSRHWKPLLCFDLQRVRFCHVSFFNLDEKS